MKWQLDSTTEVRVKITSICQHQDSYISSKKSIVIPRMMDIFRAGKTPQSGRTPHGALLPRTMDRSRRCQSPKVSPQCPVPSSDWFWGRPAAPYICQNKISAGQRNSRRPMGRGQVISGRRSGSFDRATSSLWWKLDSLETADIYHSIRMIILYHLNLGNNGDSFLCKSPTSQATRLRGRRRTTPYLFRGHDPTCYY